MRREAPECWQMMGGAEAYSLGVTPWMRLYITMKLGPAPTSSPSRDHRFESDGSLVSTPPQCHQGPIDLGAPGVFSNYEWPTKKWCQIVGAWPTPPGVQGPHEINLPIFKDEDKMDAIIYQSWCWDIMVYHPAGWKDCTLLPYIIHSLQGYLGELVRSSGTSITSEGVITVLDEHHNNVKSLDALNQDFFQLQMANKETVSDWGVHLLRHLQILVASFPERFPPDHVTKLKWDCFYGGLLKELKVTVAYLKATTNEKTYSDYLWVALEAKKEEMMETSQILATASTSKLRATSFFSLWNCKGSQPAITPSAWMVHIEEKSTNEEECIDGEDPDGIESATEEFILCLAGAVRDTPQMKKHCYHCNSPDHFICNCPQLAGMKADAPLNWKEWRVPRKGGQAPQGKMAMPKVPKDGMPKV